MFPDRPLISPQKFFTSIVLAQIDSDCIPTTVSQPYPQRLWPSLNNKTLETYDVFALQNHSVSEIPF